MSAQYDLVVYGICFADLVYAGVDHLPRPGEEVYSQSFGLYGGGAYITAVAAARLGLKVAILAPFGTGVLETTVRGWLEDEGVDTSWAFLARHPLPFVTVAVNTGGDRGFLTYAASEAAEDFLAHSVKVLAQIAATWVHLGARPGGLALINAAQRHSRVSLGVGWIPEWLRAEELKAMVGRADLLFVNAQEALAITGAASVDGAARLFEGRVIITEGDRGGIYVQPGFLPVRYASQPVEAVDTTGAGDNFAAGVLAGLIHGASLGIAVQLGSYVGAQSVQGLGGNSRSPSLEEANQYLQFRGMELKPWQERRGQ